MMRLSRLLSQRRLVLALGHDTIASVVALQVSLLVRLGGDAYLGLPKEFYLQGSVMMLLSMLAANVIARGYRSSWRYFSTSDLLTLGKVTALTLLIFLPLSFLATRVEFVPRSTYVINSMVLLALLAGPRLLYRMILEGSLSILPSRAGRGAIPVLVVGAGHSADAFLRSLARTPVPAYRAVGILDDETRRFGALIQNVPVIGNTGNIANILENLAARGEMPHKLVVAEDRTTPDRLRGLLEMAERFGIGLARVPNPVELHQGIEDQGSIRPIAIEDLLGRPQTVLDAGLPRRTIAGRRVLVTGAGGSIGSELARQIATFEPARLILTDLSEFNLYSVDLEIAERFPGVDRVARLLDVRDARRVDELFAGERPDVVFHAAALKHVPIVEEHPLDGIHTNVFGSRNVADAAVRHGARVMVQISTDKAVHPPNVMGATKRLAESYCQALDTQQRDRPEGTRFVTVRFGNVLGSTGSVVPLFQRQLAQGGPLTVTHPDVTRYFMTISEAVSLVLQAAGLGAEDGMPAGNIAVLDMGEPVRIADLARQMIRLAGLRPETDIKVAYVGLRRGEKLHEELFYAAEKLRETPVPGVRLADPRLIALDVLAAGLERLEHAVRAGEVEAAYTLLGELVPDYRRSLPGGN